MTITQVTDDVTDNLASYHNQIATAIDTGWTPVGDTWAYASASTITVPAGAADIYSVGDKIKITQTTAKYFYIVTVADTLLTVTAGTDYTVANEAITEVWFSKAQSPLNFPQWFTWAPTLVGWSSAPTVTTYKFAVHGRMCTVIVRQGTVNTSDSTSTTLTAPITAAGISNGVMGYATDNSATLTVAGRVSVSSGTFTCRTDMASGAWTASGNKGVNFTMSYEI